MNTKELSLAAWSWYDFNWLHRHYHNWGHATTVAENVQKILNNRAPDVLVLAAWWHDAVYVPGAGSDANERCSAAALGMTADHGNYEGDISAIDEAKKLIIGTAVENHLSPVFIGGDQGILLDADLGSLADPYDLFLEHQTSIILEQGGNPETDGQLSADFLSKFLTRRDFIYHTGYGRETWEDAARANINRYILDNK